MPALPCTPWQQPRLIRTDPALDHQQMSHSSSLSSVSCLRFRHRGSPRTPSLGGGRAGLGYVIDNHFHCQLRSSHAEGELSCPPHAPVAPLCALTAAAALLPRRRSRSRRPAARAPFRSLPRLPSRAAGTRPAWRRTAERAAGLAPPARPQLTVAVSRVPASGTPAEARGIPALVQPGRPRAAPASLRDDQARPAPRQRSDGRTTSSASTRAAPATAPADCGPRWVGCSTVRARTRPRPGRRRSGRTWTGCGGRPTTARRARAPRCRTCRRVRRSGTWTRYARPSGRCAPISSASPTAATSVPPMSPGFPHRTGRMVLDGVVGPEDWYDFDVRQSRALLRQRDVFFAWAGAHPDRFGLGAGADAVRGAYARARDGPRRAAGRRVRARRSSTAACTGRWACTERWAGLADGLRGYLRDGTPTDCARPRPSTARPPAPTKRPTAS